jgi:hypothetical protein
MENIFQNEKNPENCLSCYFTPISVPKKSEPNVFIYFYLQFFGQNTFSDLALQPKTEITTNFPSLSASKMKLAMRVCLKSVCVGAVYSR